MSNPTTATLETAPETEPSGQPEQTRAELDARDRCDACGHRAWVKLTLPFGELTLCGHHYAKNEAHLAELGASVHDERHRLSTTPAAPPEPRKE